MARRYDVSPYAFFIDGSPYMSMFAVDDSFLVHKTKIIPTYNNNNNNKDVLFIDCRYGKMGQSESIRNQDRYREDNQYDETFD